MKYNEKIIDFFKKHHIYDDEMFIYLQNNSTMIDYKDEDQRCLIGCFYILDRYNILQKIVLNIPYVYDEKTMLISIHEITHGIDNYKRIGKKMEKNITIEALPMLYEKLYILENPSEELISYGKYLDKLITDESDKEYKFALSIREELLKNYQFNILKTKRLIKKLSRKY